MADDQAKVRVCAVAGCNTRMSSLDKDRHLLCPGHTGWQCSWDQRCEVCRDWTDQDMKNYVRLQTGKARKKAHKEKKKAAKRAAGMSTSSSAHSLSPSSVSSSDIGEVLSVVLPAEDRRSDDLNVNNLGDGINFKNCDQVIVACSPSDNPLPVGDVGQLGLDPVVLCGNSSLAIPGNVALLR